MLRCLVARWQKLGLSMAVAATASLSCGGGTTHGDARTGAASGVGAVGGSGGSVGGAESQPTAGGTVEGSTLLPACSSLPYPAPRVGNPCAAGAPPCSCRDDELAECQTLLVCALDRYAEQPSDCEPPAEVCPPSVAAAFEQPCHVRSTACPYPGAVACYCAAMYDISGSSSLDCGRPGLSWYCGVDDGPGGCPEGVPDKGSACEGDQVFGEACFNMYSRECVDGAWQRARPRRECL